jgi:uncharacterized protein YaeQ
MTPADELTEAAKIVRQQLAVSKRNLYTPTIREIPVEPLAELLDEVSRIVRFETTVNNGQPCLRSDQEAALAFARAITKAAGQ